MWTMAVRVAIKTWTGPARAWSSSIFHNDVNLFCTNRIRISKSHPNPCREILPLPPKLGKLPFLFTRENQMIKAVAPSILESWSWKKGKQTSRCFYLDQVWLVHSERLFIYLHLNDGLQHQSQLPWDILNVRTWLYVQICWLFYSDLLTSVMRGFLQN